MHRYVKRDWSWSCVTRGSMQGSNLRPAAYRTITLMRHWAGLRKSHCVFVPPGLWGNHPGCLYGQGLPCGVLPLWGEACTLFSHTHTQSQTHGYAYDSTFQAFVKQTHTHTRFTLWSHTHLFVLRHTHVHTHTHTCTHSGSQTQWTWVRAANCGTRLDFVL